MLLYKIVEVTKMYTQFKFGLRNEEEIIDYLNHKRFSQTNQKWQKHIKAMFPDVREDDLITCKHYEDVKGKPDMVITINKKDVYVSIKTGRCVSMHHESFDTFTMFLREKGVSEKTIRTIKFFHYGETEKLNNNGKPFTPEELKSNYMKYFVAASKELDKKSIIDAVIWRCVLKGGVERRKKADFLYYGNLEKGYLLSEEDIYNLVFQYRRHEKSAIHFGGLNYHPSRRERSNIDFHDCRIKWPILCLLYYRTDEEIRDIISGKLRV